MPTTLSIIELFAGNDEQFDIPFVDGKGNPVDITDWEFWLTCKANKTDADEDAIFQLSTDGGAISIVDAAGGVARATLAGAKTSGKQSDQAYFFEIQYRDQDGRLRTSESGFVWIKTRMTEAPE